MPSHQRIEEANGNARGNASRDLAMQLARQDIIDAGIDPDSSEAQAFVSRVEAFGIMGAQPPEARTQETTRWFKPENAINAKEGDFLGLEDCSCGRVHQVFMGKDGPLADTGWY